MIKLLVLATLISFPLYAQRPKTVKPYVKKDGTYVQPHIKTTPNKTKLDNYSTKGNVNPITGKKGSKSANSVPKPKKP